MQFKMMHADAFRDSLLYFLSDDVLDLVLQFRIELVRVEPTTVVVQGGHTATGGAEPKVVVYACRVCWYQSACFLWSAIPPVAGTWWISRCRVF